MRHRPDASAGAQAARSTGSPGSWGQRAARSSVYAPSAVRLVSVKSSALLPFPTYTRRHNRFAALYPASRSERPSSDSPRSDSGASPPSMSATARIPGTASASIQRQSEKPLCGLR